MHSSIKRFNDAIDTLRKAQLGAADLWRQIDTPEDSSPAVKRVPWTLMEEMDRRLHAVSIAVAQAESAAIDIQGGTPRSSLPR